MRKLILAATMAALMASTAAPAMASEWYEGGTLAKASLGQWNSATNANRMATGADFFQMIAENQGLRVHPRDSKPLVIQLVACMNEAIRYDISPNTRTAEAAAACAIALGWMG